MTLGWSVVLSKLRAFQDAGHLPVLIVGDFTARVGDPSGRSKTRPMLTPEQIDANAKDYLEQFGRIIDLDPSASSCAATRSGWARSAPTGCWSSPRAPRSRACSSATTSPSATRANQPISLQELMYPLLQGWDSVNIDADIEIGGTDQTFNLLVGRDLQEQMGQRPQIVMTHELLVGTDGTQKMSQSLGNYVGLTDSADEMYGKTMSIPDAAMPQWYPPGVGARRGRRRRDGRRAGAAASSSPWRPSGGSRARSRRATTADAAAEAAAERFRAVFSRREVPTDAPEHVAAGGRDGAPAGAARGAPSGSRRAPRRAGGIAEGAVRLDGEPAARARRRRAPRSPARTLQVGRRFVRLVER